MDKVVSLLGVQKQSRDAQSISELGFVITNKTHDLIPYKQAVFWTMEGNSVSLISISGMAKLERDSSYAAWLCETILKNMDNHGCIEAEKEGQWLSKYCYNSTFRTKKEGVLGGVWIEVDKKLTDNQNHLLHEISEFYTQSLTVLVLRNQKSKFFDFSRFEKNKKIIIATCLCAFLFPVKLSITAPAEVIAANPSVITMPYDGVLDDILVKPGDKVEQGDIIAKMDETIIAAEMDKAEQSLKMAQASLSRAGVESLRTEEKKSDLQMLRSEIAAKKIDYDYARQKLGKTDIKATENGVAIFSDSSALKGKALATGEKIMMIANPDDMELLVRIPAQSLLPMEVGQDISFYLNAKPLAMQTGVVNAIGYQATEDSDGLLTYKVRASLTDKNAIRIGWQGTAKIKSGWSIWGYSLLRRPLIALRHIVGV